MLEYSIDIQGLHVLRYYVRAGASYHLSLAGFPKRGTGVSSDARKRPGHFVFCIICIVVSFQSTPDMYYDAGGTAGGLLWLSPVVHTYPTAITIDAFAT